MQKLYFLKLYHQNNHGQGSFDKKNYQDAVLVSFTETPPTITTSNNTGKKISSTFSSKRKGFATKLR